MKTRRNLRRRQRGGVLIINAELAQYYRGIMPILDSIHDFGKQNRAIVDFLIEKMQEEVWDNGDDFSDDLYEQLTTYVNVGEDHRQIPKLDSNFERTFHDFTLGVWDSVTLHVENRIENFRVIYSGLFGQELPVDHSIYILCDSGPGNFGNLLSMLKGEGYIKEAILLLSPTTISDSATSMTGSSEESTDMVCAGLNRKFITTIPGFDTENTFPVNFFDRTSSIDYVGVEYTKYSILDGVEDPDGDIGSKIVGLKFKQTIGENNISYCYPSEISNASELTSGPSIRDLVGLFIDKNKAKFNVSNYAKKNKKRIPIMRKIFESSISKSSLLDIKRAGDWDQVRTAVKLYRLEPEKYNNKLIFCTGDELCATYAVLNGLPTIFQVRNLMRFHSRTNLIINIV
jgi:hypothetical protein